MRNRNTQNLKLGLFVILGLIIFVTAVYFIGNQQNLFGENTRISSVFKNISGLQPGNNVRFAGVNVGTVKNIDIVNDTSIVVDFLIQEKSIKFIRKNTRATISSDGLVGSMVVNLVPDEYLSAPRVQPGDTIESISKIATADMLTTLNTTNENAAMLTADLLKITAAINRGEGTLGALIKDTTMATDIKESVSNLRRSSQSASAAIYKLNKLLSAVNYEESVAGILLSDTTAAGNVQEMIGSLGRSASEIEKMTANLNHYSEEIRDGDGLLNYMVNDTSFVNHLEATIKNAEKASKKLDENMKALQHNFLFRGYFRRLERKKAAEARENEQ